MYIYLKKYLKLSVDKIKGINRKYVYIILCFLLLSIISMFINKKSIFIKDTQIKRQSYGGNDKKYNIDISIGDKVKNKNIEFIINNRRYKKDELLKIFEYAFDDCVLKVLGDNSDFNHIDSDFNFFDSYCDGINVIWEFKIKDEYDLEKSKKYYKLVENNGKINFDIIDEEYVEGNIEFYLKGYDDIDEKPIKSSVYTVPVVILQKSKTDSEMIIEKLLLAINDINAKDKNSIYVDLPKNIDGFNVKYIEKRDYSYLYILFLGIIVVFLLKFREKYNEKEKEKNRHKILLFTYSKLISKLLIYVSSGLTIRNSISRIGREYYERLEKGLENKNIVYDKIYEAKINLDNGIIESNVYKKIAGELNDKKYSRFFNILIQNINNGNKDFRDILSIEASDSLLEKKNNAKKLGEEAATKLIIPLMLELVIVMLVIIVPAFVGIQ